MPEFFFTIKLDDAVDAETHQAFTDMLISMKASMGKIAQTQKLQSEQLNSKNAEIAALRAENNKLREEWKQLAPSTSTHTGQDLASGCDMNDGTSNNGCFAFEKAIRLHDSPVHSVTMNPSSELLATASWDAVVKLYDMANHEVVKTLGVGDKMGGLYAVAFAKSAPHILGCTSSDKYVYLWNHTTGELIHKLAGHTDEVNGIDFHSSQQVMSTASDDQTVLIWDHHEGIILRALDKHTKPVYGTTFLGQENQYWVATCCFDQKTRVFDMRDKQVVAVLQTHTDDVIGISYSSDRQLLATGSDDGLIGLWCTRTWKLHHTINTKEDLKSPENEVKRVSFGPRGDMLAAACSSGRVLVYNMNTIPGSYIADLSGHTDCVFDATWGECPRTGDIMLVSASHDHTCRYWRSAR